ncbi:hypothetical protein [Pyxidicoccus xibeiensis]|uniref:hypothetical protein n=1 Tax=Pyxidicoccus xibeiensis TaxID=2906759 RepID=UPI0020A7B42D|nr:hypothetical protein [Pyxidicoccus xibeiensis]MCP3140725.1 hypothetical protein [Pyxidicoccus xibeiensis]
MHPKMMGRLLAAALLSVAAGCQGDGTDDAQDALGTQEANAETQCVQRFDGINSCATGNARLTQSTQGLKVSGLVDATRDGVASRFSNAVKWSQSTDIKFGGPQGRLELAARSGDQVVSTLKVVPGRDGSSAAILPTFTGSPGGSAYRMSVYNNGVLQGTSTQPAGRMMVFNSWRDLIRWVVANFDFLQYDIIIWKNGVQASAEQPEVGACAWRMRDTRGTFSVTLDDGRVLTGNEVEFTEVIADGHYPYTAFTGIDVKAAASELTILGESIVQAK